MAGKTDTSNTFKYYRNSFGLKINLLGTRLLRLYFNLIYNQVYDLITAKRRLYRELQDHCISKLNFHDNERVLCAGVGTGNEIIRILNKNKNLNIIGVDYSRNALRKATKKADESGVKIETSVMDLRNLRFENEYFDKVICIHVLDFITEYEEATAELMRILKPQGEFVITYPAEAENPKLAVNLIKDGLSKDTPAESSVQRYFRIFAQIVLSVIYFPLLLRSRRKTPTRASLADIFTNFGTRQLQIEAFPSYNDFIVTGSKL